MGWGIAILGVIVVVGIGGWLEWRMHRVQRKLDQFVTLSRKRRAELLDESRRQGYRR
jgi:hypothetical protein